MVYEAIKTYVDGLDEKMEGGVPKGHAVLVAGTAGTMKSTFCFSMLYHNATHKKKHGVYITLEQGEESLHQQMEAMGYRMNLVQEELTFVDVSKIRGGLDDYGKSGAWLDFITEVVMEIHKFKPIDIVAFDSLGLIEVMTDMKNPRRDLFGMISLFKRLGTTTLLISEMNMGTLMFGRNDEDFLVDGIIHLVQQKIHDVDHENRMRVVKMRGVNHTTSYHQVHFKDGRFSVSSIVPE
jgi:KaiC/GvpD/RAD55 family RecA-like ATPase